jgi:hypothetical protein
MNQIDITKSIPGILVSKDKRTFVFCGSSDERIGHGVCLKSEYPSDVGKTAPGFKLDNFTVYESSSIPEEWKRHIDNYKKLYKITN